MDILKRILSVMVFVLVILVGAGLYYSTRHTGHGINLGFLNGHQTDQKSAEKPADNVAKPDQKVNVVLEPDLRTYIDQINQGINLINEANGLITSDPFFADPPKITQGKLDASPLEQQLPKDRTEPVIIFPDGTYQIIGSSGLDMRNVHRGIYKLGQGMTILNIVLDRMGEDIRNNNFPVRSANPGLINYPYYINPYMNPNAAPGITGVHPTDNMAGMAHGTTGSILDGITVTTILYVVLITFLILAIVSVFGFVFSFLKPKPE